MRRIGTVDSEGQAQQFVDYLRSQQIKGQAEAGEGGEWSIWIYDEDQVARAKEELEGFRKEPNGARYVDAGTRGEAEREKELREALAAKKRQIQMRDRWQRPIAEVIPVTLLLVLVSVLVTVGSEHGNRMERLGKWMTFGEATEGESEGTWLIRRGETPLTRWQLWRMVTPIFVHLSWTHLLFNMMWMMRLGGMIEGRIGQWRFLGMVVLMAVISNWGQFFWKGPYFGGMSGVVYGLFGFAWMRAKYFPEQGYFLNVADVFLGVAWMLLCMTGNVGPVANAAHLLGMLTGVLMGLSAFLRRGRSL